MTFAKNGRGFGVVALLIAGAFVSAACGERDPAPPPRDLGGDVDMGGSVDMGTPVDMTTPVDMPEIVDLNFDANFPTGTLTINGTLTELTATGAGGPIEGVLICVIVPLGGPCVMSAADGTFTATGIPETTEMLVELTAPLYQPALATVTTGTTDVTFSYLMAKRATVSTLGTIIGQRIDATKGQIFVQAGDAAGVTVTLSPASGTGPFYSTATGIPSRTLTETTVSGAAVFANVDPGEYIVTFSHATLMCPPTGFAWAGTVAETTRVPVQADHVSSTVALCM